MKLKSLLFLALAATGLNLKGQTYEFSSHTKPYEDLENSISVNNGEVWDDPDFVVPVGFDFKFYGKTLNSLYFAEQLGGQLLDAPDVFQGEFSMFMPYAADLMDRSSDFTSESPISYALEGEEGSRVFKLEWKNSGFYEEGTGPEAKSYVNIQLWFYEGSNVIEMHYGPNHIANASLVYEGESGPMVGLVAGVNMDSEELTEAFFLYGSPAAPKTNVFNGSEVSDDELYLNGPIPEGTVYRFAPEEVGIQALEKASSKVLVYPNPSSDFLRVSIDGGSVRPTSVALYGISGNLVRHVTQGFDQLPVHDLNPGVYILEVKSADLHYSKKVTVTH